MVRLLIEDVTLLKDECLTAHIRFRGGATEILELARPLSAPELRRLDPAIVAEVDRLLNEHNEREIADILNARSLKPSVGDRFSTWTIWRMRSAYRLESRFDRLRRQGLLTLEEMAAALGVHPSTVKKRQQRGQLESVAYNDKNQRLYLPLGSEPMTTCHRCGKDMPERTNGMWRKWCSVSCRTNAYHDRRRTEGSARPKRNR